MRTVILGPRPHEVEALIESRRRTGADRRDELWEGDYHMNTAPRKRHAILTLRVMQLLGPAADREGLVPTSDFNLGVEGDYRIPDGGLHVDATDAVYVATAPLVVEVLSPGDETMEKLPFYAARGVGEVVLVDPLDHRVTWLRLVDGEYAATGRSDLLDLDVDEFAARIDWPPTDGAPDTMV